MINGEPRETFQAAGIEGGTALRSAIVCPLQFNDVLIGCLSRYDVEPNHYTDDHRRLLERVAEQAGAVLHNSIVFEQTQEDSLTDPLTGLSNRRSMFVHLSSELARAERQSTEVAVIVIDIDGLKTSDCDDAAERDPPLRLVRAVRGRRIHRRIVRLYGGGRRGAASRRRCSRRPIVGCIATRPNATATRRNRARQCRRISSPADIFARDAVAPRSVA